MLNRKKQDHLGGDFPPLTDKQEEALISLAILLKKTHIRLIVEGWKIEDGVFIPPPGYKKKK